MQTLRIQLWEFPARHLKFPRRPRLYRVPRISTSSLAALISKRALHCALIYWRRSGLLSRSELQLWLFRLFRARCVAVAVGDLDRVIRGLPSRL